MKILLRHLELILTAAGLLVIFGATALVHPAGTSSWTVAAITAISVGVLHGVLFWVVRQRQRQIREVALAETERMLRDVVANQLAVIRLSIGMPDDPASAPTRVAVDQIEKAILGIHETISDVSEESLARWHSRYGGVGATLRS
jgi:hypothetical protein